MQKIFSSILVGSVAWILCAQYFVVEMIVAAAWKNPVYSFRDNYISDLGATICPSIAPFTGMTVCSPLAAFMNASFIANGILIIIGSIALSVALARTNLARFSLRALAVGALGLIGVGLVPENTNMMLHTSLAIGFFLISNSALIAFGISLIKEGERRWYALYTILSGVIGDIAFIAFALGGSALLGTGVLERIVGDPLTIWLIVTGMYALSTKK